MKSSYQHWRKSSHSMADSDCIEVGHNSHGSVGVRDTKQQGRGPVLTFSREEWVAFLQSIRGKRLGSEET